MSFISTVYHWENLISDEKFLDYFHHFDSSKKFQEYKQNKFIKTDCFREIVHCRNQLSSRNFICHQAPFIDPIKKTIDSFSRELNFIRKNKIITKVSLTFLTSTKHLLDSLAFYASKNKTILKKYSTLYPTLCRALSACEIFFLSLTNQALLDLVDSPIIIEEMGKRKILREYIKQAILPEGERFCVVMDNSSTTPFTPQAPMYWAPSPYIQIYQPAYTLPDGLYIPEQFYMVPNPQPFVTANAPQQSNLNTSPLNKLLFCSSKGCFSYNNKHLLSSSRNKLVYQGKLLRNEEESQPIAILSNLEGVLDPCALTAHKLSIEFANLQKLQHTKKVIEPHEFFWCEFDHAFYGFLMEDYAPEGSLFNYLSLNTPSDSERINLIDSVINAVFELYQSGFMHGDLKLENLVKKNGVLFIDMEGAIPINSSPEEKTNFQNTPIFTDPAYWKDYISAKYEVEFKLSQGEILTELEKARIIFDNSCHRINEKSEIWSLGLVLYALRYNVEITLNMTKPITEKVSVDISHHLIRSFLANLSQEDINHYFQGVLDPLDILIHSMLSIYQEKRPSMAALKAKWDAIKPQL